MRILIAGGGTGGHIYPALAVVRSLRTRRPDVELRWVGGNRGIEAGLVPAERIELRRLWLRSLRTVDLSVHTVLDPVRLGASVPQAAAMLSRWRPDAIFTTGGYVAIPVLTAAAPLRVPSVMWEGNAIAGRSVRATARLASALSVSFERTCERLAVAQCYVTGTPTRQFRGLDPTAARGRLGLPTGIPTVLIFGGSQTVRRFDEAVAGALPTLVERVQVLHVTGMGSYPDALRRREALPAARRDRYRPYPFLREEMSDALVASDLLVGRAGSSTLAEATALGLPIVVVPYPHAGGHQMENARILERAGAARVIADEAFTGESLAAAVSVLDEPAALRRMREASRALGRPGAADANAALVLALAERQPLPAPATIERLSRGHA